MIDSTQDIFKVELVTYIYFNSEMYSLSCLIKSAIE